jgi:6-phosphogluconolactonase
MNNKHVEVLPDKAALIERGRERVLSEIRTAIARSDRATIALAGGGTPKPLYEALAKEDLPWDKIHIFWGDERYVPPDHPDSNQRMAREAWLDLVPLPPENIHPMPTGAADPAVDARTYEQELQAFFELESGTFPKFDLILLGIGDDAHTASLFPGTEALQVRDRLVTVGNKDGQPRLTLTVPSIDAARCVLFLVSGAGKQEALDRIFAPEANPFVYPARFVQPREGQLWWLLDDAAGGHLGVG